MANPTDNLRRLYQNGLKHFTLPDYDTFQKDMMDEQKRRRFYNNMLEAYTLPDFDTFSQDIGAVAAPAPAQPVAQAQAQPQPVAQVQTTVKPITDTTAQQASVQQPVQTAAQPAQPEGWNPTPTERLNFQFQMDQAYASYNKHRADVEQRMEGIKKGNSLGAIMGERELNPQTGQMEAHYYTRQGERVGSRMEQGLRNSDYQQWWENNTEEGRQSKENRLQREFNYRLSTLWERHNPAEGENAAEKAWTAAEARQTESENRIAADVYRDRGDFLSNVAFLGGPESHVMNASETGHRNKVAQFTNFDLDRMMDESWDNLGEDGQASLIDDCYEMLRSRNPGVDELVLYNQAKEFARQQSDLRLYNLAVEKNMPKGNLDYLMRKIGDMNLLMNITKGMAVSSADGKTGDMAAYEAANEEYRQDGHKILDVTGMVAGFALDPTTWVSAGVGGAATRGAMWLGGRWLAGRGATAAATQAATRQFATSMTGRIVGGVVGGAANFGTFEGIKEIENQFAHGGKVATMDENGNLLREGRYVNEGYSAGAVGGQLAHGLLMGGAVGWLGPVSGNVSDQLVRATSSTAGKVLTRAGVYTGATIAEGTIFSVPEWIEGKRDAMDVWTDNMAMMAGFKAKHVLKSAGGVLGDLKASFESPTNGQKNRLDFESRLRRRMDAPSDGGLGLTEDEKAELKRYGYDLQDLVESAERTGNASEGGLIAQNAPEIVSRLTAMVADTRVSEAARAKLYYYATGRRLPMSTVMRGELIEDGEGGFIVESQGANGVITSRSFKSRKAADLELERINRQVELNSIEIGERYQQTADFENRLQEACRTVAAENGWDMVEVYRTCEEARRNHLRGGDKQFDEAQQNILRKVTDVMGEFEETGATDVMRGRINEKYGVDIDGAIRKEANRRTLQEQTAIDEYIAELIPNKAKEPNPVEDAQAEDITNQKLLRDEPDEPQGPAGGEPIGPRFENSAPAIGNGSQQRNGEQVATGRAVMKFEDRPVEVLSGRVVMMEDGTMVDNARSDATIVIRDLATGEVEMVSPEAILTYEDYAAPMPTEAEGPIGDMQPQPRYTSGRIKVRNSDGTETRGILTGHVDENGKYEYYLEGDLQHLHYASLEELESILSEYVPDELQIDEQTVAPEQEEQQRRIQAAQNEQMEQPEQVAPIEPTQEAAPAPTSAEAMQGEVTMPTGVNRVGTIAVPQRDGSTRTFSVGKDAEGMNVVIDDRGFMWGHDGNGNAMQPYSPGANIPTWTDEQLSKLGTVQPAAERSAVVPNQPESVASAAETPQNRTENAVSNAESAPDPIESVQAAPAELTALQRIPRDAKGEPIFEQAESPEHGWDALVEFADGDAVTAKEIADTMVEEKRKVYEKAQKQKPKGKTPTEILASKRAITEGLAQAEQEYNLWYQMAGVEQRRQDVIRAQQEAEARQRAQERAEEEARQKAEREEEERQEREALNGVPDWNVDTPADARARGYRRYGPQKVDRPEIIDNQAIGKAVTVKFGDEVMPSGNVVVIEAAQLQPSHLDGQRNPAHFLDEAQPKERKDAASRFAAAKIAETIRPEEITSSVTAYTGAPSINSRGEVIQGNNRSEALRQMYESNAESAERYKQYLIDHAADFGLTPEAIATFEQPVLVNMLDVSDKDAITLGQYVAQDTESGGIERIKPKNAVQKMGNKIRTFANLLLRSADEEATFAQLVDSNGREVLKWMNQQGLITNTQYGSAFDIKGNLTAEAANDLKGIMYQSIFTGGSTRLEEMFNKMPSKAQRAILATAFRDYDSAIGDRMIGEIQQSIIAFDALMSFEQFRDASNAATVQNAVEAWKKQYAFDDVSGESYLPSETFSNFALAALYKGQTQRHIQSVFNMMYDIVQGTEQDNLFEAADKRPKSLAEAIRRVLNIDYKPIVKPTNNDGRNGSAVLGSNIEDGQDGRRGGGGSADSAKQNPTGTEPSERGEGAEYDIRRVGTEQAFGKWANDNVATREDSNRRNSLGVIGDRSIADFFGPVYTEFRGKGAEAEAYLCEACEGVAKGALIYPGIAPIDLAWGDKKAGYMKIVIKHPEVVGRLQELINQCAITNQSDNRIVFESDTHKFIVSKMKGSTPTDNWLLTGYEKKEKSVSASSSDIETEPEGKRNGTATPQNGLSRSNLQTAASKPHGLASDRKVTNSAINKQEKNEESSLQLSDNKGEQPVATIEGEGYKIETKPYTNKQGKTLDTYLVTFDRDFSKEELSALRAKAKALKGWYDRESKGWMLRSSDDAKAFAVEVTAKSEDEVADEAPLSMADMEKSAPKPNAPAKPTESPMKKVDVEGMFDALKSKGETKLSDHAEPVEASKPKKRRKQMPKSLL